MSWWMAIGITISNWNPLKTIFQKLFLVWLNSYKRYFSNNSTVLQRHMLRNNQSKLWYDWSSIVNNFLHFKGRNVLKNMKKNLVSIGRLMHFFRALRLSHEKGSSMNEGSRFWCVIKSRSLLFLWFRQLVSVMLV